MSRSSFGAFYLQSPVLIALALALRPVGAPAEVKLLLVAGLAVAICFGLAHLLITRVPGLDRIF